MRIVIGGIVAGIVVFMWGSVTHILLQVGAIGLNIEATPAEAAVVEAFEGMPESGIYMMPGLDPSITDPAEQMQDQTDRWQAGPAAMVVLQKDGGRAMGGQTLAMQGFAGVLAGWVAALVLAGVKGGYVCRVLTVGLMGLFTWFNTDASYWIWYGFSDDYTLSQGAQHVSAWLLAGLALAAIVKPCAPAAPAEG